MAKRTGPVHTLTQTVDYKVNNEVLATCNSLGYFDEGKYIKEPDCKACIKDLIRFLRADNANTFDIRRQLGSCNLIANDLLPIMKQYCVEDNDLFDLVLRLMVSLTNPALLLFKEEMPTDRDQFKIYLELIDYLFSYKQTLAYDVKFWSVIAKHLLRILQINNDQRQEEDKIMFERMLILLRNALHVPSQDEINVVYGEDNVHDKMLIALKLAGMFDILLHICQTPEEHEFCFHILEIFSLIFKEQRADILAKHTNSMKVCDYERKNDVREMKELLARDQARIGTRGKQYGRFKESTYTVQNYKLIGDRDLICHKFITDVNEITLDKNKRVQRKAKNRQHLKDNEQISNSSKRTHSSSFEVKRYLRDLCSCFLNDSYNLFMKRVRYYLERSSCAENDETYYLWASDFFMEFNRHSEASCELIKETLTAEYLHYLHCLIEMHLDRVKTDKKHFGQWSKRLHHGIKAYREILFTVAHVISTHRYEAYETADEIKRKIFYEQEHRELLRTLLLVYDPVKMSDGYLNDLIEANHVFLKLFEYYVKKNKNIVIQRKKRKAKRRSAKKEKKRKEKQQKTNQIDCEQQWNDIENELLNKLQSNDDEQHVQKDQEQTQDQDQDQEQKEKEKSISHSNPNTIDLDESDLNVFDMLSTLSKDEQKMNAMKRINSSLRNKHIDRSIKLLRTARYFFLDKDEINEDNAFGRTDVSVEQELQILKEIFTNEFLIENNDDLDHDQDINEEDAEEESEDDQDDQGIDYKEENLEFFDFIKTYATPKIIYPFCLSLKNYEFNPMHINNYIIKMFHRLAFDCCMYAQFFQLSILRTFQNIMNKHNQNDCYNEIIRFAKFIVQKLVKVSAKNDKTFVEVLYWKTTREAYELEEGYGSSKVEKKNAGKRKRKSDHLEDDLETNIPDDIESSVRQDVADKYDQLFGKSSRTSANQFNDSMSDTHASQEEREEEKEKQEGQQDEEQEEQEVKEKDEDDDDDDFDHQFPVVKKHVARLLPSDESDDEQTNDDNEEQQVNDQQSTQKEPPNLPATIVADHSDKIDEIFNKTTDADIENMQTIF